MAEEMVKTMYTKLEHIEESLAGTIAQINRIEGHIKQVDKDFKESIAEIKEIMNLIIKAITTSRENTSEELNMIKKQISTEIEELWEKKSLESITQEQLNAISEMKKINSVVEESLYMAQLLSIIQMIREMTGRAIAAKMERK